MLIVLLMGLVLFFVLTFIRTINLVLSNFDETKTKHYVFS